MSATHRLKKILTWTNMSVMVIALTAAQLVQADELDPKVEKEVTCLAKNIYYEAGLESYEGKVAVAQVTVNRSENDKFPDTICGVVNQKTRVPTGKTVCQFSWVCDPTRSKIKYYSDRWENSLEIARNVIVDGLRLDHLDEALYFHNTAVRPNWGLERIARIGGHIFYSPDRVKSKRKG